MPVKYSPEQLAAINFIRDQKSGNLMLTAVAGSGKTFTLIEMLKAITGKTDVAFCAFSKNISVEIAKKVRDIENELTCKPYVGTCHSFGNAELKKRFAKSMLMDSDSAPQKKIDVLMDKVVNKTTNEVGVPIEYRAFVRKAYSLARQWGVNVMPEFPMASQEAWLKLVDHFDLEDELFDGDDMPWDLSSHIREAVNWTVRVIKLGVAMAETMYDFEDMIYLPLVYNMKMQQYDVVFVDECQDLNPTRRALAQKMLKVGGRAVFVGDPRQAIFGFTGADHMSVDNIIRDFNCTVLPLSWSFRCPKTVVQFAKKWVNHIESTPDAPEGITETINEKNFWSMSFNASDAVLCRNNAPLVDLFFSLMAKGIPAHIEGKDIAADLIKMVNRFPKVKKMSTLVEKLIDHKEKKVQKYNAKGQELKAERIADVIDAIVTVAENLPADSPVSDLRTRITSMFQNADGEKVKTLTLTTIHKAKGREFPRVFWWGRNLYNPSKYARKDWQILAEDNLCYVAATRSKAELYDVQLEAPEAQVRNNIFSQYGVPANEYDFYRHTV